MQSNSWTTDTIKLTSWWRNHMETYIASLALCAGNSPAVGEFPALKPVTRSFDGFFDLRLNKRLSNQSLGRWFEMPSRSLCRQCNVMWFISIRVPAWVLKWPNWQHPLRKQPTQFGHVTSNRSKNPCYQLGKLLWLKKILPQILWYWSKLNCQYFHHKFLILHYPKAWQFPSAGKFDCLLRSPFPFSKL